MISKMEEQKHAVAAKPSQCQIEDCNEISVGSKVPLCRKHRNKTYKQNYKKKKKHAEGNFEENSQELVINDQYLLEQKYSNMLQDALTQKQMVIAKEVFRDYITPTKILLSIASPGVLQNIELFESPSVVELLKSYQNQKLVGRNTATESNRSEQNNSVIPMEHVETDLPTTEVIQVMNSSTDFSSCHNFTWNQNELTLPCEMLANLDTTYPNTSILQPPPTPQSTSLMTQHSRT